MSDIYAENTEEAGKEILVPEKTYAPAGFWMRFWAYLIDIAIAASINGIILTPLFFLTNLNDLTLGIYTAGGFLTALVSYSYFVVLTKFWGQTLGKRIMGIKVLSDSPEGLAWKDVIMREVVGRYIHQSLAITNILYVIVAFHPKKKGLHDIFADTHVVLEPRSK
ncbi:RDD family protein [Evansella sp. LMS18]|uniref:RDD family protein n=1 Tax=Evansella sp. LMS18 TaxID=2924033 RepID=UPI0020D1A6E4|nr:RDD family protein [Evansella sp. LMS18]UTR11393.1 RDD family protein [Evansella sp. LMS18]